MQSASLGEGFAATAVALSVALVATVVSRFHPARWYPPAVRMRYGMRDIERIAQLEGPCFTWSRINCGSFFRSRVVCDGRNTMSAFEFHFLSLCLKVGGMLLLLLFPLNDFSV